VAQSIEVVRKDLVGSDDVLECWSSERESYSYD
jgi:hypothetical protein